MTPTSLTALRQAEAAYMADRYPSVPEHARAATAWEDKTTNGLTRCIVSYIRYTGGYAERISRMGHKTKSKQGREIWVSGAGVNGTADISGIVNGRAIRVEVKNRNTRDRIRPNQVAYSQKVKAAGALYFVATGFDEFLEWFKTITTV